ncbi:hypothetical protein OIV83_004749 [Microbotryomycetes sp. JL201]|nr:hypothetical protein OIV83_004749 [Microbotryomycetes sp. JL201]
MKTVQWSALLLTSSILLAQAYQQQPPAYADWGQSDLKRWLQDHHVPAPHHLNEEQLRDLVKTHYKAADDSVQHHFGNAANSALSGWSESELRKFLLDKGIISPHSTRDELESLARQHGAQAKAHASGASASVSSAASVVSSGVSSAASAAATAVQDNANSAYYAAINAPSLAYDTAAEALQGK